LGEKKETTENAQGAFFPQYLNARRKRSLRMLQGKKKINGKRKKLRLATVLTEGCRQPRGTVCAAREPTAGRKKKESLAWERNVR